MPLQSVSFHSSGTIGSSSNTMMNVPADLSRSGTSQKELLLSSAWSPQNVPMSKSSELLKRRLDEAAKHISLDQLAISPQCGFGGLDHIVIPEEDQWRKFERMLEVATDVWGAVA